MINKQILNCYNDRLNVVRPSGFSNVLKKRLLFDWVQKQYIPNNTSVTFGLIAGKVHSDKKHPNREEDLQKYFSRKGWFFWGPTKIKKKINDLGNKGYENNLATITAKILLR